MTRPLRIAMIGSRGVPATYGGIERHVEEIGARLAERGHSVTVYCRPGYTQDHGAGEYRGMRTVTLPTIGTKHLEALTHTAVSAGSAVLRNHDVYHFHAVGPGLCAPMARASHGAATVLTVHGLDFDRDKWSPMARRLLKQAEWVGARWAHELVVVAPNLVEHYRRQYGIETRYIPNGVNRPAPPAATRSGDHLLFVGRLTPEKAPHLLIDAFKRLADPHLELFIVGGSSHTDDYVAQLHEKAAGDPRVHLLGYVYGQELADLYASARLFVQPSRVEGMPLTVLEAASHGAPLLVSDIPVHRELIGFPAPGRRWFRDDSVDDLTRHLGAALQSDVEQERRAARDFGEEVLRRYSWDDVVDTLEELYRATTVRLRDGDRRRRRQAARQSRRPASEDAPARRVDEGTRESGDP